MLRNIIATGMLIAGLAACTSKAAEPDPHPTPSPNPSGSPTEVVPAMPDAARAHTKAGAEAFVVYYWQVVDYAQRTLDVTLLSKLSIPQCVGCKGGIGFIRAAKRERGSIRGGEDTVSDLTVRKRVVDSVAVTEVDFSLTNTAQTLVYPDGRTKHFRAGTVPVRMLLQEGPSGWMVQALDA